MAPKSRAIRPRAAALAHKMPASSLGIWISDSMLLQALEQYQRAVATAIRRINSHAGPLESRRRATKRHMTGLMATAYAYPPIWQFDVGPNMLQWEAPTSQAERRHKREQTSVSGLFNSLVGLLDGGDKPFLTPPGQLATSAVHAEALAASPEIGTVFVQEDSTSSDYVSSMHIPEEIALLRSSICILPTADESALARIASTCRKSLRRRIQRAEITTEALVASMQPLDSACVSKLPTREAASKMTAKIRRGILQALIDAKPEGAAAPQELWLAFSKEMLPDDGENHDITTVCRLLSNMPASAMANIPIEGLQAFIRNFIGRQASLRNRFSNWSSRAVRVSRALRTLSTKQQQQLDVYIRKHLEQQDLVADSATRLRFSWLIVKAQNPQLTTEEFVALCRETVGYDTPMNSLQVWQVAAARLAAVAALDNTSCQQLAETRYASMRERWNALITAAMPKDGLRELCAALYQLGELGAVARTVTTAYPSPNMTATLASGCTDHAQMLEIAGASKRRWAWSLWTEHIEALIKDADVKPLRPWQVLDLQGSAANKSAKMELLDKMGVWFTQAKHLSERQVLRQVQRCVDQQKRLTGGTVSPAMLVTLAGLVMRDLQRGERGRASRMEWLVDMVGQSQGPDEALDVAVALKAWRGQVDRDSGRC